MMQKTAVLLIFLFAGSICCEAALDAGAFRHLLRRGAYARSSSKAKSTTKKGKASTSVSATSTGGEVEAVATATADAFTEVSNSLVEYFRFVFDNVKRKDFRDTEEEHCQSAFVLIEETLDAAGEVVASAYTDALATVEIKGKGSACAQSEASAQSQATGFAEIIVEAIAEATYRVTKAQAEAAVNVVTRVIAEAFASSFAKACLEDEGSAFALQTSFGRAIVKPLATASVLVASGVDCTDNEGYSLSEVSGEATQEEDTTSTTTDVSDVQGKGEAETGGEAGAFVDTIHPCTGVYMLCCKIHLSDTCYCNILRSKKCNARRQSTAGLEYWYDSSKKYSCSCTFAQTNRMPYGPVT